MKNLNKTRTAPGFITIVLIGLFLSGKIIDIPNGTHQGGLISAIGVGVILITMIILTLVFRKIFKLH